MECMGKSYCMVEMLYILGRKGLILAICSEYLGLSYIETCLKKIQHIGLQIANFSIQKKYILISFSGFGFSLVLEPMALRL